ncbi:MAG: serine/threonine-protein kinase [Acidiferrobacterales bacterium]
MSRRYRYAGNLSDDAVQPEKAEKVENTLIIDADTADAADSTLSPQTAMVPAEKALAPGDRLEHYVIEGEIGTGGMGIVYKANDTLLNRVVALKVLPPELCEQEQFLRRFAREARLLARIDSHQVVTVHTLVEKEVGLVLVMEYLEGETLEQRLHRSGPVSVKEAVAIFDQASLGVEHIHVMGVVHQDLKPGNIFLTADGCVKLLDFGVAKLMDEHDFEQVGTMQGTLLYISPEQIKGHQVDQRSDVYTLGVSLFEAVTGRLPFERKTNYALMHAHVQEAPPPPTNYQTEIPGELEKVILKAIAKEPERRFQTIRDFHKALLHYRRIKLPNWRPAPALLPAPNAPLDVAIHPSVLRLRQAGAKQTLLGSLVFDGCALVGVIALALYLSLNPAVAPENTSATRQSLPSPDKYASVRRAWGNLKQ